MFGTNQSNIDVWCERIRQQQTSGMNIKTWCLQNNLSNKSFTYWKMKINRLGIALNSGICPGTPAGTAENDFSFVEIKRSSSINPAFESVGRCIVRFMGAEIVVDRESDPRVFQGVLKVLQTI